MIRSKEDLKYYLLEDRKAQHKSLHSSHKRRIADWFFPDLNYEYTRRLRLTEYYLNCGTKHIWGGVMRLFSIFCLVRLRQKTGIEVHPNCVGPGLHIVHGKIVVSPISKIGRNCKILSDVTVGINGRYDCPGAPQIGDRVYIGSGARIIGNITIADDVVIGANTVVVKSITEPNTTWAGNPARKVSDTGSYHYLNKE